MSHQQHHPYPVHPPEGPRPGSTNTMAIISQVMVWVFAPLAVVFGTWQCGRSVPAARVAPGWPRPA